jgi:UDP-2,3-diacylglucosamine hydrolase
MPAKSPRKPAPAGKPSSKGTLGIIAGSGTLPKEVIENCLKEKRKLFVVAFTGITEKASVKQAPHVWLHLGKVGEAIRQLKKAGVKELVLVGRVGRPSFASLKMDYTAIKLLANLARLSSQGDDAVFSAIIRFLESYRFKVIGVDKVLKSLLMPEGILGKISPDRIAQNDIRLGAKTALAIGKLDIGQAVIIQRGMILGVEGAEGTDRLISRCKELKQEGPGGVLVKMKKPGQDARVDLPSIGIHTVENAYASGLRGIAVEAGGSLILGREKVVKRANELGIFLAGISPQE